MSRPVIGITIDQHSEAGKYESPADYSKGVELAGGLPVLLPYQSDLALIPAYVDLLDGILFTGGDDLDPARLRTSPASEGRSHRSRAAEV